MTRVQSAVPPQATQQTMSDLIDRLSRYEGTPDQFLLQLLAVQCHTSGAEGGAIVHMDSGKPELLAIYPQLAEKAAPPWLAEAVKSVPGIMKTGRTSVVPLNDANQFYGQGASHHLILIAIKHDTAQGVGVRGAMVYHLATGNATQLAHAQERLELTASLLSLYELRLSVQAQRNDMGRLKETIEVHSVVNDYERFQPAAMAMCNELATRANASRVSIGFKRGRYIHLLAMSHTENLTRKTALSQAIESVMEECSDQDVETLHPAPNEAPYVSRAASELSQRHGPCNVLSLPLRRGGEPVGVVTLERPADQSFSLTEVETLRLACDLCAPRLIDLQETDRWVGVRAVKATQRGLATILGPKHTWAKLTVLLLITAIVLLSVLKGPYRADASFVIESRDYRVVAMPYEAVLAEVNVEPGDEVQAGQVLARLKTFELENQRVQAVTTLAQLRRERDVHIGNDERADADIKSAQIRSTEAEIELIDHHLEHAEIKSPIAGVVIEGDLKRQIDKPIELGTTLFRVAPLQDLYGDLMVPEDQIADVYELQKKGEAGEGTLALASHPGDYIPFKIERINPVAELYQQRNVFRVRVRLEETRDWIRPGNQGVAKIDLAEKHYVWIWTRPFTNWVRMTFWI